MKTLRDSCETCKHCVRMDDIGMAVCRHSPPSIKGNDDAECALYPMVGVELNVGWDYQYKCGQYQPDDKAV